MIDNIGLEDPKYVRFHTESYVNVYRPLGIFRWL